MMKFLLKKKIYLYSTGDYVTYLSKNKNVNFQMDIFRNNTTDLQIIYNKFEYGINELKFNPNQFVLVISFSDDLIDKDIVLENFRKFYLFKDAIFFENEEFKNRYVLHTIKDYDLLYKTIKFILYEIYGYNVKDTYSVGFIEYRLNKSKYINHTYISWFEYFFKRK